MMISFIFCLWRDVFRGFVGTQGYQCQGIRAVEYEFWGCFPGCE